MPVNECDTSAGFNRLQIRRLIAASPERVFRAWTDPRALKNWWGPKGVRCVSAEIDLKIGGKYRITNELPDGSELVISGQFRQIERPRALCYSWHVEADGNGVEKVSVRFEPHASGTEVFLTHEQILTEELRDQHQHGWLGCLQGLDNYCVVPGQPKR